MDRNSTSDDRFVSRRKIIRSGTVAGLATLGLTGQASAHDEDEAEEDEETTDEEGENTEEADGESEAEETEEENTEEEEEAEEAESEETEEEAEAEETEEEEAEREASVSISDQEVSGESVEVDEVSMSEGGFVSIHDRRRFDGEILGSIIGITDFLEAGSHSDVSVPFFTENATAPGPAEGQEEDGLTEAQPLIAIPHRDNDDSGEFNEGDTAYQNGPKTLESFPVVNDIATVTVEGDDEEERDAAAAEEAEALDEF